MFGIMVAVTVIRQGYRFAVDPTAGQAALLASFAGASRFWFNQGLALVKERLEQRGRGEAVSVPWSYKQLCSEFRGDAVKDEMAPWRHGCAARGPPRACSASAAAAACCTGSSASSGTLISTLPWDPSSTVTMPYLRRSHCRSLFRG